MDGSILKRVFDREYSNQELVEGIENGDSRCAALFHRRYGKRISQLVWSLLGADQDHDDVIQMVFVNILDSVSTVKDPSRLDYWIDGVTFRTVRKELRSRRYRRQVVASSDSLPDVVDFRNPQSGLVSKRFYRAMNRLKTEERIIFILKYFEDCTLLEMSEISGWSVATVKRRINNALNAFKKLAREDEILSSYIGEKSNAV